MLDAEEVLALIAEKLELVRLIGVGIGKVKVMERQLHSEQWRGYFNNKEDY